MTQIKLNSFKVYSLTKIHSNGKYEFKIKGFIFNSKGLIEKGESVVVGYLMGEFWATSPVTSMEKTGKGIIFETLNSTYLLEEVNEQY